LFQHGWSTDCDEHWVMQLLQRHLEKRLRRFWFG
jgi:hypothetical protein